MAIEQRPGTEEPRDRAQSHLTGTPEIDAEWSGGDSEELPRLVHPEGSAHGKLSSWLVVITVFVAFAVAGVALILKAWVVIWICVAIIALMFPVAIAVRIMDDTVGWARPTPGEITRGDMTRTATRVREDQMQKIEEERKRERHVRK
ncbi:hypothetical protein [Actinocorallia populi]|uniref:hypothetical protein n=1 Tax=Actinocorallia populi TaxID=2079200 RepID=UPI000D0940A6|nr:hypothetical protein [Actinocorallia populi]